MICVADDGPGIPEEAITLVREPFVRLDHARQRDTSGFGLGLSIVSRVVAEEGGTFELANREEGGLAATIRLRPALPPCKQSFVT
jgi:signal transduction histidine kinase